MHVCTNTRSLAHASTHACTPACMQTHQTYMCVCARARTHMHTHAHRIHTLLLYLAFANSGFPLFENCFTTAATCELYLRCCLEAEHWLLEMHTWKSSAPCLIVDPLHWVLATAVASALRDDATWSTPSGLVTHQTRPWCNRWTIINLLDRQSQVSENCGTHHASQAFERLHTSTRTPAAAGCPLLQLHLTPWPQNAPDDW